MPLTDILTFVMTHDACGAIALELPARRVYRLHCDCGATIEQDIPGTDDRYRVILASLALLGEN